MEKCIVSGLIKNTFPKKNPVQYASWNYLMAFQRLDKMNSVLAENTGIFGILPLIFKCTVFKEKIISSYFNKYIFKKCFK